MARKLQVIGKFNLNSVLYTEQTLTTEQKEQARKNIGIDELPSNTAEQIQADYNQNDSSKLDFIKNRPFYEDESGVVKIDKKFLPESTELTEIIEERVGFIPATTRTSALDSDYGGYIIGIRLTDEEANTWLNNTDSLIVTFDGEEYDCEIQEIEGNGKSAGNLSAFGGTGNNEPFALSMTTVQIDDTTTYYYLGVMAINDTAETEHTIIVDFLRVSEKIKEEFLPDIGSGLPEVTADDSGKFLQVVDGVWTVVSLTNVAEEGA